MIICDSLRTVNYRHSLFWSHADIILMYNCFPFNGHYSTVMGNLDAGTHIGCQWAKEDKQEAEGRKKGGTSTTEGGETTSLAEDEMVVKKED